MKLSHADLIPMLLIAGGAAFGTVAFGSISLSRSPSDSTSATNDAVLERGVERDRVELLAVDIEEVLARAAELVREQRDIEAEMARFGASGPGSDAAGRLLERMEAMSDQVAELERAINELARGAMADHETAASWLYEAAATIRDDKLQERLRYARGFIGVADRDYAREFEAETTRIVEELQEELQRASEAMPPAPGSVEALEAEMRARRAAELARREAEQARREAEQARREAEQEIRPRDRDAITRGPVFTPMTVRPEITNRDEVVTALMQEYPPELRDAGIEGRVVVWFYITETGQNIDNRISGSSGHEEFDRAALTVASIIRFTPASYEGEPVPVWIEVPITFQVR